MGEPPLPSSSCVCHRSTRSTRPLSASPASSPSSPCTTTCASSTPSKRYTPCFKDSETGEINYNKCDADAYGYQPTGIVFNDAYRYIDWLLTVPMLLTEIILVMGLDAEETRQRCTVLGISSALMIAFGYPGEISAVPTTRWLFWCISMVPFCYIVYTLFIGLKDAQEKQIPEVRSLVKTACYATVV